MTEIEFCCQKVNLSQSRRKRLKRFVLNNTDACLHLDDVRDDVRMFFFPLTKKSIFGGILLASHRLMESFTPDLGKEVR